MGEVYSHLSEEERRVIRIEIGNGTIICGIVLMLGRNASTVGREIKRDTWFPSNENESAGVAAGGRRVSRFPDGFPSPSVRRRPETAAVSAIGRPTA